MSAPIRRTATTLVSVLAAAVLLAGPVGAEEVPLTEAPPADSPAVQSEVTDAVQAPADVADQTITVVAPPEAVDTILDAADKVADSAPAPVGGALRTVTAMARETTAPPPSPPAPVPAGGGATQATGGPVTELGGDSTLVPVHQASSVPIGVTSLTGFRMDQAQAEVVEADLAALTAPHPALAPPTTASSAPLAAIPIDRAQRILAEFLFGTALLVVTTAALVGELGPDRRSTPA